MEKIDITCTATLRPELLKRTLESFKQHLFKDDIKHCRLIINIDRIGHINEKDKERKIIEIFDIINKIGFEFLKINVNPNPHFGHAFMWCMNNVETELFFHLEEDWELKMDLNLHRLLDFFYADMSLAHLRLSMFKSEKKTLKNWNKFLIWNGRYFEIKADERGSIGWAGHPSMNRLSFMNSVLPYIDSKLNPEKQIKHKIHPRIDIAIERFRFGSFHPQESPPAIEDIGRKWMIENGWAKSGNKAFFTKWEKNKEKLLKSNLSTTITKWGKDE